MKLLVLEGVESFLEQLTPHEVAKVIHTLELLEEFGHTLSLPHSRHMKDGLLELRISGQRPVRIFYCFHKGSAVLLHAFIKKTQQTPTKELRIAKEQQRRLQ